MELVDQQNAQKIPDFSCATGREGELKETREKLEAAKDAVSRLTAQLEANRDRPEPVRDRERLVWTVDLRPA